MSHDSPTTNNQERVEAVVGGSITISGLLAGFMLVFIGFVISDLKDKDPSWLQLLCLFCATALLGFFYRAMVKGWNLLAVRAMAETGDRILDGETTNGPDYAAFRELWAFQPNLYQGSWFVLVVVALYAATKSWWTLPAVIFGFLLGLALYVVLGDWRWKRVWRKYGAFDKCVYLGQPIRPEELPMRFRLYLRIFSRGQENVSARKRSAEGESESETRSNDS